MFITKLVMPIKTGTLTRCSMCASEEICKRAAVQNDSGGALRCAAAVNLLRITISFSGTNFTFVLHICRLATFTILLYTFCHAPAQTKNECPCTEKHAVVSEEELIATSTAAAATKPARSARRVDVRHLHVLECRRCSGRVRGRGGHCV